MRRANEALLLSNAALERFAASVSHDLKEPLATIHSYVELAMEIQAGKLPPDVVRCLGVVQESANRMDLLITDLLGYAHASGRKGQNHVSTNLENVLKDAIENLEAAARRAGAVITHDPLPSAAAEPFQMVLLFQNLIGNAIKYRGREAPIVHISAVKREGFHVISVSDNGEGFPLEEADRIFKPFERLHGKDVPGTGIGLATCAKIVETHGGRIWATSEPGRGSIFRFTLPLKSEDPAIE